MKKKAEYYQNKFGIGLVEDQMSTTALKFFSLKERHGTLRGYADTALKLLINNQETELN